MQESDKIKHCEIEFKRKRSKLHEEEKELRIQMKKVSHQKNLLDRKSEEINVQQSKLSKKYQKPSRFGIKDPETIKFNTLQNQQHSFAIEVCELKFLNWKTF